MMDRPSDTPIAGRDDLVRAIEALAPWHMNIRLTSDLSIGEVFSDEGMILDREKNQGISLVDKRESFLQAIDAIYPDTMSGKTLLDCACNAGAFCFWARERNALYATGFDVREHWLRQAQFIKTHRNVASTDETHFFQCDLYDLPSKNLQPFSIVTFAGLFDHLPDPINGLRIAAGLASEVLLINSFTTWGDDDGYLKIGTEPTDELMCGVHELKWMPTGPRVICQILKWMGFKKTKLRQRHQSHFDPRFGVAEIFASRFDSQLDQLQGEYI